MAENGKIIVDLSEWTTMGHIERWQDAAASARVGEMNSIMAEVVRAWPFDGDPSDAATFSTLTPPQWMRVGREVREAVADLFQGASD